MLSTSLTKAQQLVTASQSTSMCVLCMPFVHLLNNCASVHSASVILVWIVVHALFRHVVGLAHLSSLHTQDCIAAKHAL